ncbi:nucleotidyltransferase family protein [Rhodalgimonas zhirmunskyi]|uniref:Nucleotidyltransferase family protein n=1 Tax=Rhodalgimonas zhirmunskyi TaxID=2964767 RepID=A0AAJ1U4B0_9RHOB|nr:nucleotidyltransferase family protein [Rhodoalgimonas zhirmunskyi]MDQ2092729.1 nucleotidyltransferase family protein [Rhodoalgimonas zhirmunskyi]
MSRIPILILAAGASSRMRGRDKLLEMIDDLPLIRRQAEMARTVSQSVIVALPAAPHPRHSALEGLDVTRIEVPEATLGMGHSIAAGVSALPADARGVLLMLADLPDLRADDLKRILHAFEDQPDALIWRGATEAGKPGHPILFHRQLFPALQNLTGDVGAKEVVRSAGDRLCLVPLPGTRARRDLDTPEDWTVWRQEKANKP